MNNHNCPFCGAQDICVAEDDTHDFCNECGARGPMRGADRGGWNEREEFAWESRIEKTGLAEIRQQLISARNTITDLLKLVPGEMDPDTEWDELRKWFKPREVDEARERRSLHQ